MSTLYTYTGPVGINYYSQILPALQSAAAATGIPVAVLEAQAMQESTWGGTRYPNFLSLFTDRVPAFTYAGIDANTVSGQALAAARYLAYLANQCGSLAGGLCAYNAGHCVGGSCTYSNDVMSYVSVTQSYVAPIITISPSFGVSGTASVTSGGHILGTLRLVAVHGSIPYRVTMSVSPSYGSSYPTSTTATGTAAPGTTNVNQSLVAPLPSEEIIRTYQQQHSGPVTFGYTINWSITDPSTGVTKTVTGGKRVTLTVQ